MRSDTSTCSFCLKIDLDFAICMSPLSSNMEGGTGAISYFRISCRLYRVLSEYLRPLNILVLCHKHVHVQPLSV